MVAPEYGGCRLAGGVLYVGSFDLKSERGQWDFHQFSDVKYV